MSPRTRRTAMVAIGVLLALVGPLRSVDRSVHAPPPLADDATVPWLDDALVETLAALAGSGASFEDQVMEIVNQERWDNGQLPPLKRNDLLESAAELHSFNMGARDFFAHCDLDTKTNPGDRIIAAGYSYSNAGENAAAGQSTPQSVMTTWMGSTGHRANILSTTYRELGIGYALDGSDSGNVRFDLLPSTGPDCNADSFNHGPYYHYWTQDFGRDSNVYPMVIEREAFSTPVRDVDLYLYGSGWAQEMRIRNAPGGFSAWQPFFSSVVGWQLTPGGGTKTVIVEIRNGGTTLTASDTIQYTGEPDVIFPDGFESGDVSAWSSTSP